MENYFRQNDNSLFPLPVEHIETVNSNLLTKTDRAFIGSEVNRGDGSVITIKGLCAKKQGTVKIFTYTCPVCSSDEVLYHENSFKISKADLKRGKINCGCGKRKHTKREFLIKVLRVCSEKNYKLLEVVGDYKGFETKIKLMNLSNNNIWGTNGLNFLLNKRGCPKDAYETNCLKNPPKDDRLIKKFIETGAFKEGTLFRRSSHKNSQGKKTYFYVSCPICKEDEFTKNGLCKGEFKASLNSLREGSVPCRCSDKHSLTYEQRVFNIKRILEAEGSTFISLSNERNQKVAKIDWNCSCGNRNKTIVHNFINQGHRCTACSNHGYRTSLEGCFYISLWHDKTSNKEDPKAIKIGITNKDGSSRMKDQQNKTKLTGVMFKEVRGDGLDILNLEKLIKNVYKDKRGFLQKVDFQDGYTETLPYSECLLDELVCILAKESFKW